VLQGTRKYTRVARADLVPRARGYLPQHLPPLVDDVEHSAHHDCRHRRLTGMVSTDRTIGDAELSCGLGLAEPSFLEQRSELSGFTSQPNV